MADQAESQVVYRSIYGFLGDISRAWHPNDVNRFGAAVGKTADAAHIAYREVVDVALGAVRAFPEKLLRRLYDRMAVEFGWPKIVDAETPAIEDPRRQLEETLRSHERAAKHLRKVIEKTESLPVLGAMTESLQWFEQEAERIRGEIGMEVSVR